MMSYQVCLDASVVIRALIPGAFTNNVLMLFAEWEGDGIERIAPALLPFEVSSALRRLVHLKQLDPQLGEEAFNAFMKLDIALTHRRVLFPLAWQLACELKRPRTYDTAYLALAQLKDCDLWTADERFYNAVREHVPRVRWVGAL